jgi:hypothetical protein
VLTRSPERCGGYRDPPTPDGHSRQYNDTWLRRIPSALHSMSLRWRQISASLSLLARAGEMIELRGDFRCWHFSDLMVALSHVWGKADIPHDLRRGPQMAYPKRTAPSLPLREIREFGTAGTSGFDASNGILSDRPGTLMSKVSSATRLLLQDSGAQFRRDRRSSSDP